MLGALLGNDMTDPTDEDVERARQLMADRSRKAIEGIRSLQAQGLYDHIDVSDRP